MYTEYKSTLPTWTVTHCILMRAEGCLRDLKLCIWGAMSVYLSLARSRRKKKQTISAATTALWYPLLSHWAVETSPYLGIHGPPRRLSQILRRPQALLLLFQLLWIPLARQLIGGNNKLGSLQPLTNMSPTDEEERRDPLMVTYVSMNLPASVHTHTHTLTHAEQRWPLGWQRNGYQCNLPQRGPEPLSSSICL